MNAYSKILIRFSGVYAFIGAFIGSHMAGSKDYIFQSIHAHVLLVGWLTLFAWAVYYKIFSPKKSLFATIHVISAIIGSIGLTLGMYFYNVNPFNIPETLNTVMFIVGGSIMLLSFFLFAISVFLIKDEQTT